MPEKICTLTDSLDRMALASLIFNNKTLLEKVNSLVHPVVFDHFRKWERNQTAPYVIMEAAILFESGASKLVDKIATIVAPEGGTETEEGYPEEQALKASGHGKNEKPA